MASERPQAEIYVDESRQTKDRFMVLGGIVVHAGDIEKINATMKGFRVTTNMTAELKWSKISNQKVEQYKTFADYFFAMNNANQIHFHCLVVDNHALNHNKFSGGDRELGFYKFYYQLLLHSFASRYGQKYDLHVRIDSRSTKTNLEEFKQILNSGYVKKHGGDLRPFRSVEPRDSKKCEIIQINDIVLGAVSHHRNGIHLLAETRLAKRAISQLVLEKSGLQNYDRTTPRHIARFGVWNFRLQERV